MSVYVVCSRAYAPEEQERGQKPRNTHAATATAAYASPLFIIVEKYGQHNMADERGRRASALARSHSGGAQKKKSPGGTVDCRSSI
eukprot:scaffold22191_cov128-Isochrysis_galbana.AAC.4